MISINNPNNTSRPGAETTEFKVTQQAAWLAYVTAGLGIALPVVEAVTQTGLGGPQVASVLLVLGVGLRAATAAVYTLSRAASKLGANETSGATLEQAARAGELLGGSSKEAP